MISKTLNPVWNKQFLIDVPANSDNTEDWESITLNVKVWHVDNGTKTSFLGCCILSSRIAISGELMEATVEMPSSTS